MPKNEKKPDDRQILLPTPPLHFTVYLFNREIIQPEIERVQVYYSGRNVKRFWRKKERFSDFKREHTKVNFSTKRPGRGSVVSGAAF